MDQQIFTQTIYSQVQKLWQVQDQAPSLMFQILQTIFGARRDHCNKRLAKPPIDSSLTPSLILMAKGKGEGPLSARQD